jgi:VanZ family protein
MANHLPAASFSRQSIYTGYCAVSVPDVHNWTSLRGRLEKSRLGLPLMSTQLRWKLLGVLYFAGLFLILFFAYRGELPPILTQNDKLAHVLLYGMATFIGHKALAGRSLYRRIPLFPALFSIFTLAEEIAQAWSPNRTFDLGDLAASFLGIAIGWWLSRSKPQR